MKTKITSVSRQRRQTLINNGFTVFEANQLQRIPTNAPYLTRMIEDRQALYVDYYTKTMNPTKAGWKKQVDKLYINNGWLRRSKLITIEQKRSAVWNMVHEYEKKSDSNPQDNWWESNSARKTVRRSHDDFSRKFDKTLSSEQRSSELESRFKRSYLLFN